MFEKSHEGVSVLIKTNLIDSSLSQVDIAGHLLCCKYVINLSYNKNEHKSDAVTFFKTFLLIISVIFYGGTCRISVHLMNLQLHVWLLFAIKNIFLIVCTLQF